MLATFKKRMTPVVWGFMTATLMLMSVEIMKIPMRDVILISVLAEASQFLVNLFSKEETPSNIFTRGWNLFWEANLLGLWGQTAIKMSIGKKFLVLILELLFLGLLETFGKLPKEK